jgi:xylan 1,4-beta-xylosidase
MIRNPVLPGFHPDPSIVRVGDDYYVATSTFEWCPGVRIHHSRDLVNWRDVGGVLDATHLLDLAGRPDSAGVWAPNLSYADGLFHLVFSNLSTYAGGFTDCYNYVTTAPAIEGPWSDPVLLHSRGFDASLFHDGDDTWMINCVHDWRPGRGGSAGLEATRYDRAARRLVGEPVRIDLPDNSLWVEGPNLYRRGDWYYLVTADGGTGYDHQVTVSRARELTGPYERDPSGPLITAKHVKDWPLQKAGHGSLVETTTGEWYMTYLVARPIGVHGPCVLGRETAIAAVSWTDDGWLTSPDGGLPALELPGPKVDRFEVARTPATDDFDAPTLGPQWSTLRRPATPDWLSLTDRPSHLRVRGGRSPQSLIEPSLVARRVTAHHCSFEATIDFRPSAFQHVAGVTAYYNSRNWHLLYLTADDEGAPVVRVVTCDQGELTVHPDELHAPGTVQFGLDLDGAALTCRVDAGDGWRALGPTLDVTILSDEHAVEFDGDRIRSMGFTGAFVGVWVWDLTGGGLPADVDRATYLVR